MNKRDSARNAIKRSLDLSKAESSKYSKQQLEVYIELLREQWKRFNIAQESVEESCGASAIDAEQTEREQGEQWYTAAMSNFKVMLEAKSPTISTTAAAEGARSTSVIPNIKLPTFNLPHFEGDPTTWLTFFDSFSAIVLKHETLTGSQKLHYLRCCLSNEPLQLISNFKLQDANFSEAWSLLITRYNIPRVIKDHHFRAIFAVQKTDNDTPKGIKGVLDPIMQNVRALKALELPVQHWDEWLAHVIVHRLANETRRQWELSLGEQQAVDLKSLQEFLETRCRSLETALTNTAPAKQSKSLGKNQRVTAYHATQTNRWDSNQCLYCSGAHKIYQCPQFRDISTSARKEVIRNKNACSNCLSNMHKKDKCRSASTCKICNYRHHTLLHSSEDSTSSKNMVGAQPRKNNDNTNVNLLARHMPSFATTSQKVSEPMTSDMNADPNTGKVVLLATALLRACDINGKQHILRALFDSGSHSSFISESCVQKLQLNKTRSEVIVSGIGCSKGTVKGETSLLLTPMDGTEAYPLSALVLAKLTEFLPTAKIHTSRWAHIKDLKLADPQYYLPARVDLIIGADEMYSLLGTEIVKGPPNTPIAQQSVFGWLLFDIDLTRAVMKTWSLDEIPETRHFTPEEAMCEKIFDQTHQRSAQGCFIVRLPFKQIVKLGDSRARAVQAWLRMEKRLEQNSEHGAQYHAFLQDMLDQGHMEPVDHLPSSNYYMPHHNVIKESSSTTKTRVVFNASQKTTNGYSLNDNLMIGPQLQNDLVSILNRFQTHKYALIADISGMYRQVMVAKEHIDYQRIIWRKSKHEPLQDFRMLRVTFGIASSSHLAIKALQQTAKEVATQYPLASSVILRDFYMDDLLTGTSSEIHLNTLRKQVSKIVGHGCFELRKWASNSQIVIRDIPLDAREHTISHLLAEDDTVRALGLMWNSKEDYLYYDIKLGPPPTNLTKRSLLSDSCRLFDPIGKLAPVTLVPKILFQRLWQLGLEWDDAVPEDIATYWLNHRQNLKLLSELKIQRWLGTGMEGSTTDLHCFADASELAYAGVVYTRTQHADGSITVAMVSAKTKVSPLRSISIAKLELCAAVLVSKLAHHVQQSLDGLVSKVYGWTDSMNALAWLQSHPSRWSVFVANRVATAQSYISAENWFHVSTSDNPADCASRGMSPAKFIQHELWWKGPTWLWQDDRNWPENPSIPPTELELRPKRVLTHTASTNTTSFVAQEILAKFSSFLRLKRITAYWLRYINNLRTKQRQGGPLMHCELRAAEEYWIRQVQREAFHEEISCCQNSKPISLRSSLSRLNVFLDDNNILRVGGRIRRSTVSSDTRFPIILPSKSIVVTMIIEDLHKNLLHGGPQLMQSVLQRRFWVIGLRGLVRKIFHKCTTYRRQGASRQQQMMADLPSFRVNHTGRPFSVTGVDMAGPFNLKFSKGRGSKSTKGYVAVFICMATGAMHLELAGDLSSETFVSVIKRFIARRGYCRTYVSDNGTNFVGAERDLRMIFQQAMHDSNIQQFFANSSIEWKFNPPSAPHMGGYWESAVKRVKFHLRRALKATLLTYEEFYTLLTEVEACVNSRPLCQLANSPSDLETLTPGHFLVGEPLKIIPEPATLEFRGSLNQRWQLISALRNHFWRRWHSEYLSTLQTRAKWVRPQKNIQEGDLVVVRDERMPPANWKLARVLKCYPGQDGYTRVVDVKTAEGLLTRPVVKLVPILTDEESH